MKTAVTLVESSESDIGKTNRPEAIVDFFEGNVGVGQLVTDKQRRAAPRHVPDGRDATHLEMAGIFEGRQLSRQRARKSDPNPQNSRSLGVRLGARWRPRRSTSSCCLSTRFSAITARTPPGPHSFAVTTARCAKVSRRFFMRASG